MTPRSWRLLQALIAVLLAGAYLLLPLVSRAAPAGQDAEEPAPYDGVDIVFLVDQSGSMCGTACNNPFGIANDPEGRRFEVARFAHEFLGQLHYTYAPLSDHPWDVRTSVIYFGGLEDPLEQIERPLENLLIDPQSAEQWQSVWEPTEPLLSPEAFGNRSLGNTNFRAAFAEAQRQFAAMGERGRRLRAIIVVTDGQPAAPTGPDQYENALVHMDALISDVQKGYSGPDDLFYVVALNDRSPYWTGGPGTPAMQPYWQQIVGSRGFAELIPRNAEVTAYVQRAINDIVGRVGCIDQGSTRCVTVVTDTVEVLPYLHQITFILHKIQPEDTVEFSNGGQIISLDAANVTLFDRDKLVETIVIRNPPPGMWQIRRLENRQVTIFKWELLETNFTFEPFPEPDNVGCGRPSTLLVRASGPDGTPIQELPGYPIAIQMTIDWPGAPQTVQMGSPVTAGVYQTREFLTEHGDAVQVRLNASTVDPQGQPLTLYDDSVGAISTPECGWLLSTTGTADQYSSTEIGLQLVDGIRPLPLVADGEYEISASLDSTSDDGSELSPDEPVEFTRSADGLNASIPLELRGCGTFTLSPEATIRDIQTGRELVQPLEPQTLEVECKEVVRMDIDPSGPINIAACDLRGTPATIPWNVTLVDENGTVYPPQQVLAQPSSLPFQSTVNPSQRLREQWGPPQLPPADSYQYLLKGLATDSYTLTVDFVGALNDGYVKDSTTNFTTTVNLLAPENVLMWRSLLSGIGVLALALLGTGVYFFRVRPTLGPVFFGDLALTGGWEARARRGPVIPSILALDEHKKRQNFTPDDDFRLQEYADRLEVRQDPRQWDMIEVTQIFESDETSSRRKVTKKLKLGQFADLENRDPALDPGMLEYRERQELGAPDEVASARTRWLDKQKADRARRRRMLLGTLVLAVFALAGAWQFLPLGC